MRFEPTFESLRQYSAPEWFRDAKFGIWSHWGPQSVPMFGDWYARNMYIQGQPQYEYHLRHYGHPSKFGYKDICALWKAEKFDPDALIEKLEDNIFMMDQLTTVLDTYKPDAEKARALLKEAPRCSLRPKYMPFLPAAAFHSARMSFPGPTFTLFIRLIFES